MNDPGDKEVAIFGAALELPAGERAAYLDEACGGDSALRQRIEAFLVGHAVAGEFLETPAPGAQRPAAEALAGKPGAALVDAGPPAEKIGDRIGRYKLLQQIGEGGCGVVYMAEQEEPVRRKVALKVIKLGMDTKSVIARFEAERQALALMEHPNIARVFDAGATNAGRPFFVMELVRGVKITDYCDQNQLPTRERLGLFVQVCQAIQHAHQKGVIHRDIKPSNILVTVNDGMAVPKVIDFGIAKATQGRLTERTLFTAFEQFVGTPAYMSPEQALMTSVDIDTRSDIYSLGVLLYELMTGKTPFDPQELMQAGFDEMRRTICEKEPARPSTRLSRMPDADLTTTANRRHTQALALIHTLRGDLDWIVMKSLAKDRARRYETCNGLARDVLRYLADEPVLARPPGHFYVFTKLVRRHKLAFAAAAVVALSLILGLGAVMVAALRIQRDNRQIRQANADATEKLRASYLAEARALRASGRPGQRFASLEAVRKAAAIHADLAARNEAIASLAVSDLRVAKQTIITGHAPRNEYAKFDLNLERYAFGDTNGNITIRAASNNLVLTVLTAPGCQLEGISGFSSNGKYICALYRNEHEGQSFWVWDVDTQKPVFRLPQPADDANRLNFTPAREFSPDSQLLASSGWEGAITIYDLASGMEIKRFPGKRAFEHLDFSPGNTRLACSSRDDSSVEILEVESGRKIMTLACSNGVSVLAWSPDGKRLATGCVDFHIDVWDADTGQKQAMLEGSFAKITSLSFNHAGNLLASSGWDGMSRLWNPDTGRQVASHAGGGSWELQFSPDDRYLLGWQDVAAYGWLEVAYSRECRQLYVQPDGGFISGPEFSADGRILAASSNTKVRFWDTSSGKEIGAYGVREGYQADPLIFHPDGRSLIAVDCDGISVRSVEHIDGQGSCSYRMGKPVRLFDAKGLNEAALSLDARHLAVTQESNNQALIFDLRNPSAKVVLSGHPNAKRIAISPDGHWVATAAWLNPLVKIWDARSGELVRSMSLPARAWVTFSPDGRWLATSGADYQLWEVGTWQPKNPPQPGLEDPAPNFTAFSPDGRVMARTDGHTIQLLETTTEKPLATLEAPGFGQVEKFKFSPDGCMLAATQRDQQVQFWDLRLIRQELSQMHLDWDAPPLPPAEKSAATGPVTLEIEPDNANPPATQ